MPNRDQYIAALEFAAKRKITGDTAALLRALAEALREGIAEDEYERADGSPMNNPFIIELPEIPEQPKEGG